ncbi:MAG: tetratricopeptide repeat protein, partial [Bacteroidales bacterium]|nr:tetratricopeptide repeat protein [Bacteroidales bacterium]
MKRFCIFFLAFLLTCVQSFAQVDRREVRSGNRKFRKDSFKEAEIDYRKAVLKDSMSVAGQYNLASALYRQQDFDGAAQALSKVEVPDADVSFNSGDAALQKQDYASAVKAFREALLLNPADMDAKENYIYAKKKLEDQQNQ